jgi:hypothetical protein
MKKNDGDKKVKQAEKPKAKDSTSNSFGKTFNEAKKRGEKNFTYGGKKYTTTTAQEIAKKQTMAQNLKSAGIADDKAKEKGYKNKGLNTIGNSYIEEFGIQYAKKHNLKPGTIKDSWSPEKAKREELKKNAKKATPKK